MIWIVTVLSILAVAAVVLFVIIARKGRRLRTQQPLPPPAELAYLQWHDGDRSMEKKVECPFYLGGSSDNNLVLEQSTQQYEVCLFRHHHRFAFQSLEEAVVLVNGEEILAGYLWDGDVLTICEKEYVFRCR